MRLALNLPAHVDWYARTHLLPRGVASRLLAVFFGVGLVVAAEGAGAILVSASQADRTASSAPIAEAAAAAPAVPELTTGTAGEDSALPAAPESAPPPPPPPDYVARLRVPRLGIDHYTMELGVVNNQMQSPDADGVHAVGWYAQYGTPGRGGNSVFSAHETWNFQRGPFYAMHLAQPGDELSIAMTSGVVHRYVVISNRRYPAAAIPMGDIIWPSLPPGEEWATFITCGGRFVRTYANGLGDYLDRDVVVAKRIP